MKRIADKSIDMILCDLPYGTTQNKWDSIIPIELLWQQYERIIKDNGAIVLTAAYPFNSLLINSNKKLFKYDLIWDKSLVTGHLNAKKMPLRQHEDILVFYRKPPTYNPQMTVGKPYKSISGKASSNYGSQKEQVTVNKGVRYPTSIINIPQTRRKGGHPTQKPVALFEYLVKTYTNEGDTVLDNCMGSGTTAIAAINTNRNFIGFETENQYYDIALRRINNTLHKS